MRVRMAHVVFVCASFAAPAYADMTLKMKVSASQPDLAQSGDRTDYIKGNKLRMDLSVSGEQRSIIVDLDTAQLIWVVPQARLAHIVDLRALAADMAKLSGDPEVAVAATSRTRQIAGAACTVYDVKVTLPPGAGQLPVSIVLTGSACLAKGAASATDLSSLYRVATEKGLFFGEPNAPTQLGPARLMTALYRDLTSRGLPLAVALELRSEATGQLAELLKQMGGTKQASTTTAEVVSVSTATIPPSTFEIPAGYTVEK